jgi:hypothetical protein
MADVKDRTRIDRRAVMTLPFLAALSAELHASQTSQAPNASVPVSPNPSPEELKIIHSSKMAQDLLKSSWTGHSCAEAGLSVALKFFQKPEDLVWMASGFSGGMGQRDLCGYLISGIMTFGLYAGTLSVDRREALNVCADLTKKYWTWWATVAPYDCADIQQGRNCSFVCNRVGCLAMAKVEELLNEHASSG